jgi:ABC-type Fe3+-siderophore transport system permease subunit
MKFLFFLLCILSFAFGLAQIINKKQLKIGVTLMIIGFAFAVYLIYDFITNFHLPVC